MRKAPSIAYEIVLHLGDYRSSLLVYLCSVETKLSAIRHALTLAKSRRYERIVIETDSLMTVNFINTGHASQNQCTELILQIVQELDRLSGFSIIVRGG
ncbi:hypothetical protein VNO78_05196 [Psophocarpus tetragonolobus]|uniref:RNase H type-1 domain-containing protein n=1 Tax=Psophocarpus tetragonolobus TaxID=3891 RepID=A0AAN9STK2_PSOTE